MHEVSLVTALVEQVEELARKEGFRHVLEVRLGVGALSGVEPGCIEFCFPEVTRSTVLEGARLVLDPEPIQLSCRSCGRDSRPEDPMALICAHCASTEILVKEGRDFRLKDLEVR